MSAAPAAPGGVPAPIGADPSSSPSTPTILRARLDRLQDLDAGALREEWRRILGSEPPRISRDLLMRGVAYRLQELECGGLPKWARQSLAGPSVPGEATSKPAERLLKPGARLVREWRGRTHTIVALDDGLEFDGRPYRSLTQIAIEITGAHWSGPRFFGLKDRRHPGGPDETASPKALRATRVEEAEEGTESGAPNSRQLRPANVAGVAANGKELGND